MSELDSLLPCPFCGGDVHRIGGEDENTHDIECDGCAYIFYDLSEGNNWWNTRPIESSLQSQLDEAREREKRLAYAIKSLIDDWNNRGDDVVEIDQYLSWIILDGIQREILEGDTAMNGGK